MSAQQPKTGACFDAAAFRTLGRAYDDACAALGFVFTTYDETDALAVKEQLARHVIALATAGERNPRTLAAQALSKMPALEAKWRQQWSDFGERRWTASKVASLVSARKGLMDGAAAAAYASENAL
jgi:hypothetical protein